ncbi:CYTH domain-containing protein [Vreelandella andesensis]|uniref:CYTH domain-containing protein n=1 Tax=Vreelandella andesensis TaxID=447567 RepID=A0A433KUF4_9GAMM|nr:CYTH domain-containing protein [Halomonas andesensis]RUR33271.1 CYTH domain-containing protein [Halomonas andesensis]
MKNSVYTSDSKSAPTEIELKLAVATAQIDTLLCHAALAEPPQQQHLANTYFDTSAGDMANARIAVRLRQIDDRVLQTVKTAGHGGGGLSTRHEWEWPVSGLQLDQHGLAALPPFEGSLGTKISALRPALRTDFTRRSWQIDWQGSHIELVLDEGEIVSGGAQAAICEVELELKAGESEALWLLALTLAESVPLRPSDTSKAARGNALGAQQWPLPKAKTPAQWLHRATVALDAYHDSGLAEHLTTAQQALTTLAAHSQLDENSRHQAQAMTKALSDNGQPTAAYGVAALTLAYRFAYQTTLR